MKLYVVTQILYPRWEGDSNATLVVGVFSTPELAKQAELDATCPNGYTFDTDITTLDLDMVVEKYSGKL